MEADLPDELREAASIPRRIGWAGLLARVFAVDVTVCSKCGGRMKILEVVTEPAAIAKLLHGGAAASLSSWAVGVVHLSPRAEAWRSASRTQPPTSRREARQGR